ncbi:molybdopterin synthase catalytic subunit MoaE [Paraglaciecola aquimarina]|uniref:Molybdopterin synthase catalytic subunit n=1 Tax=Paraglaciecola aquimarina TaxID=1235557 RepID=A0ABU3SYS5_9ALTE|nr:molybdopterin synthase catalytic subunit MoaE [Paraglaciecola aquimarina]MDU0355156.1 molybdopterin synthase catalytic subunit MoaE [Paraglaciecola aquimarina]
MHSNDKISIQSQDFDFNCEYQRLRKNNSTDGAVVTFIGLVRDFNQKGHVTGLFLEHYPAMTEKSLSNILIKARQKWSLGRITIIHRVGQLNPNEQIVMVGVTSQHRQSAFQASEYIMDFLKTQAPFWKKETSENGDNWVEAKQSDTDKADSW